MASTSDPQNELRFDKELFRKELQRLVDDHSLDNLFDARVAHLLDESQGEGEADWRSMRAEYRLPTLKHAGVPGGSDEPAIYLCGNSLGPMTKRTELYVQQELDAWGQKAVLGHWDHPHGRPWTRCEERIGRIMSDMVGAKPSEVIVMSTLTANLHSMLATFYRPGKQLPQSGWSAQASPSVCANYKRRTKILYEAKAFPSDQYALASAVALAGEDPKAALVPLHAPSGSDTISTEDILRALEVHGDEVSMIMLGGLQYITGQLFDLPRITRRAHELGILAGFDLAHAFANVPLALHDWDVDFAVWCTYKYGSSGPGGIAGAFVHERWGDIGMRTHLDRPGAYEGAEGLLRPAGWWGHEKSTRFSMPNSFRSMKGAAGWQLSNPSALDAAALLGSLETLAQVVKGQDVGGVEWADKIESIEGTTAIGKGQIMPRLRPSKRKCGSSPPQTRANAARC
ncbi:kynureninase [Ceraceosorus bombacis]|uniref:Kynureninase n=1 Tax=Ceraceosorus bombacis TaxID=401625 RepID=A0A0P1BAD6_9BASI|nr:kynureninase [Ceraceosorus bombacis]